MKRRFVLHSALAPAAAAAVLRRSIDEERKLLSAFGYDGDRPVVGKVAGSTFRLQKRRYYSHNDFASHFYGQMSPEGSGTKIEGHFDLSPLAKVSMWLWLAGVVGIGGPNAIATLLEILRHGRTENEVAGLVIVPAMILLGILLPKFSLLLERGGKAFILQHLQNVLSAHMDPSP